MTWPCHFAHNESLTALWHAGAASREAAFRFTMDAPTKLFSPKNEKTHLPGVLAMGWNCYLAKFDALAV